MKILVVGLGSIGQRHVKNVRLIGQDFQIGVLRRDAKKKLDPAISSLIDRIFDKLKNAVDWKPDAVIIANPAPFHVASAMTFAKCGSHIFIEKPLSTDLKNIDALMRECRRRKKVLMVGYVMRFSQPLEILKKKLLEKAVGQVLSVRIAVGQNLLDWRKGDYRHMVSAQKKLGGGVIFELSHEIDYVRWLLGEIVEVESFADRLSHWNIDVEDTAQILLRLKNRALVSVHLDMVDRARNRSCRIIGTKGTLLWEDGEDYRLKLYLAETKKWTDLRRSETLERNAMFVDELQHFLACIKLKKSPMVSAEDGKRVVEIVLAIKKSAAVKKAIKI